LGDVGDRLRLIPSSAIVAALIGETLGQRYKLVSLLGKGGMGSVYEAEDQETHERVAVKVLHSHLLESGSEGPRRFRREAEAAISIGGDHIARVLDAGTDEGTGQLYLVTEHLEGEDLQRLLDRVGRLAPEAALRIAFQALMGLCDAHKARVVHRDIKPANIFLARGRDGAINVKLLDFGIAKIRADPLGLPQAAGLTTTGLLGSPLYMSPEQVQSSRDVDHRTDLWSLGTRLVTVDPRHFLGQKSELWTFSLDVHRHVSSLVGRVWKALRRAGARVPPLTYGTAWVLFEPRTGRVIAEVGEGLEQLSLEAAGIRPGIVLWVVTPGTDPRVS
jgi:serine/threonine protein kinase